MQPLMTIDVNENYRYAAYPDHDPFDYLKDYEWDNWGLFTIAINRGYRPLGLDTFGLNDQLTRVAEWHQHSWNDNQLETALSKTITRAGYSHIYLNLNGYSQGDWAYVVLYYKEEWLTDPSGLINELEAWFRGDVYTIALERLETYTSQYGNTKTEWEMVDNIGHVLIHDGNEFTLETCEDYLGKLEVAN